jgi:hypothetical protein
MAKRGGRRRKSSSSRRRKGKLFGRPRSSVIKRPGAFKAKARRAGMSTSAYSRKVLKKGSRASARTRKQAALAKAFSTMRKRRRKR